MSTTLLEKIQAPFHSKAPITQHVLDTVRGCGAEGVVIELEQQNEVNSAWTLVGTSKTDEEGRCQNVVRSSKFEFKPATYRVRFNTKAYFEAQGMECFYPYVEVVFEVTDIEKHYHIPLLLSNYGYTTYRGC